MPYRFWCVVGTIYGYFDSKRALFDAVLAAFYNALIADIEPRFAVIEGTADRLRFLVARHQGVPCAQRRGSRAAPAGRVTRLRGLVGRIQARQRPAGPDLIDHPGLEALLTRGELRAEFNP